MNITFIYCVVMVKVGSMNTHAPYYMLSTWSFEKNLLSVVSVCGL